MKKLSWTQRIALADGIKAGKSNAQIARELGVHRSTIGREIARNADSREHYAPQEADLRSWNRQKEAMSKRFLITFCGVEFLSTLTKRNRIYTYISRTHLNSLSRWQDAVPHAWESSYLQSAKKRFMPNHAFMRRIGESFPSLSLNTGFFGSSALSSASSQTTSNRCTISLVPGLLKTVSSQPSYRMPLLSGTGYTEKVLYAMENNKLNPLHLCHAGISQSYSPIPLKNSTASDVSFVPEIKNNRQKTIKNHLPPPPQP